MLSLVPPKKTWCIAHKPTICINATFVSSQREIDRSGSGCHCNVHQLHAVVKLELWVMRSLEELPLTCCAVHRRDEGPMRKMSDGAVTKLFFEN